MVSYEQEDSRLLGGNEHEWIGKLPELYRIVLSMTFKGQKDSDRELTTGRNKRDQSLILNLEKVEPGDCQDLTKVTQMEQRDVL